MLLHGCATQPSAQAEKLPAQGKAATPLEQATREIPPAPAVAPQASTAGPAAAELPTLSTPSLPTVTPAPTAPATTTCACPETPFKAPESASPELRGRLVPASWNDLPDWGADSLAPALTALLQSCTALASQPPWQAACSAAAQLPGNAGKRRLRNYFETWFAPYQVINGDGTASGMITGYYEPLLNGSRHRSKRYRYPLYAAPDDLLTIDLTSVYPDLKGKRLRGRLQGNRVLPYYSRAELETIDAPIKGRELVWVDDPIDAFFLQIQGSGQVNLDTGETMRVGYADQNGHPFRSVGRYLIQSGELRLEQTSMQGIKAWARRHPDKLDAFLNVNPSYVFFRELPLNLPGPLGTLGVPLTPERSIAVDQRVIPLGVPVYLATTRPNSAEPLNRLMAAQDTGGAINGGVRADFFWGFGDAAGRLAGVMKQSGRMWVLFPKGYPPPAQ